MKKLTILVSLLLSTVLANPLVAQKMLTDASVTYNVSVVKGKEQPGITEAFDGASLTVVFKGTQARSDLRTNARVQTVFYNSKSADAVMLKESGADKYMISFTAPQWVQYNKKYASINFTETGETKQIQGYNCKKAVANLPDGKIEVYYSVDVKPLAAGYEYAFRDLPGLPLQYQITTGSIVVSYDVSAISTAPVNASRFDLPKFGYKMLDYKQ